MTQLQELTEKIHTHCPELKLLTFGCELKSRYKGTRLWFLGHNQEEMENYYFGEDCIATQDQQFFQDDVNKEDNPYEILGHPITLEHVLKAIDAQSRQKGIYPSFLLAQGHEAQWQLGKPLSEQSEETIKWLNGVIV